MRNHYSRKPIIFGVKQLILFIGLLLGNLYASAQAPDFEWARQAQSYSFANHEQGSWLAHETYDNSYVTGSFNGNANFGSNTLFESGSEVFNAEINAALIYTLTIGVTGNGTVAKKPDKTSYLAGTSVQLIATPAAGYQFSGWSGDASGSKSPLTVLMNGNKNITATFIPKQKYTLNITISGSGKVAKNPSQLSYLAGTSVQLTANAATGYQFSGWSGDASGTANPLTVLMNGNKNITATFIPIPKYTLNITISGSGDVARNPKEATYLAGTSVQLTANPDSGYQFSGWSGDASGTENPKTVLMNGIKNITATFIPIPNYTLNITISGSGNVLKFPNKPSYPEGTSVQLTANPAPGYHFGGWSGDASGNASPLPVTMNGNKNITATFFP